MRSNRRKLWVLIGLAATAVGLVGCYPIQLLYFAAILLGMDTTDPAKFTFPEDAKRIAVITTADYTTQVNTVHFDQDLNEMVARKLFEGFDGDRKTRHIKVIKAGKVAKWLDEHPNWRSLDPVEIGRALDANYIIYLELGAVAYYEDGPTKFLYRGKADVGVTVFRVDEQDGDIVLQRQDLHFEYPKGARPIPVADVPLSRFRKEFLTRLSDEITWYFLPHEIVYDPGADRF